METPSSSAPATKAPFEERLKRTVYVDNLSPQVSKEVLKTALGQFGNVVNVEFIANFVVPGNPPQCALVEMENAKQAISVVSILSDYPFMVSGMPRPVRARAAQRDMFSDKPPIPGRRVECRWIEPEDPEFAATKTLKNLASKHSVEAGFMLKQQQAEEAALAKRQSEALKTHYKKYELINGVVHDKTVKKLADRYSLNYGDHR